VSYEYGIFDQDTFTDKCVTRDFAAASHAGVLLDFNKRADFCVIPNLATI
jgi:hypothetical protein